MAKRTLTFLEDARSTSTVLSATRVVCNWAKHIIKEMATDFYVQTVFKREVELVDRRTAIDVEEELLEGPFSALRDIRTTKNVSRARNVDRTSMEVNIMISMEPSHAKRATTITATLAKSVLGAAASSAQERITPKRLAACGIRNASDVATVEAPSRASSTTKMDNPIVPTVLPAGNKILSSRK